MNFTSDWVTANETNFSMCMGHLGFTRGKFLEIGCFEGRSTCWFLQNGLADDGSITCIDPFYPDWFENRAQLRDIFDENIRGARKRNQIIEVLQMTSYEGLGQLISRKQRYNFIYIDGDHDPKAVLSDACMAWGLLEQGGVMLFDDYAYDKEPTGKGIDVFLDFFKEQYDLVLQNYQLAVRKK